MPLVLLQCPPFFGSILLLYFACELMLNLRTVGSQESGLSEDDNLSDWGNDAAVYSSDSELSNWEQPEDSDAESVSSADTHQQAAQPAAAGNIFVQGAHQVCTSSFPTLPSLWYCMSTVVNMDLHSVCVAPSQY